MNIRLRFHEGSRFRYKLVLDLTRELAHGLANLEMSELDLLAIEFPDLPVAALDAARHRLTSYDEDAVQIAAVSPGSLEIVIAWTALGYWLLDKTLGETLECAWKGSEMRRRLFQFLTEGRRRRRQKASEMVDRAAGHYYLRHDQREVRISQQISGDGTEIVVTAIETQQRIEAPTYIDLQEMHEPPEG